MKVNGRLKLKINIEKLRENKKKTLIKELIKSIKQKHFIAKGM